MKPEPLNVLKNIEVLLLFHNMLITVAALLGKIMKEACQISAFMFPSRWSLPWHFTAGFSYAATFQF